MTIIIVIVIVVVVKYTVQYVELDYQHCLFAIVEPVLPVQDLEPISVSVTCILILAVDIYSNTRSRILVFRLQITTHQ
ncbi:hypothetical protein BD289DRAFT_420990 [Coniella lustricola]|uniref:Uncharacterized protein n=1 Tax=Coniella lustricola TaxID=2025994 RepID=A0A2T3AMU9_9PEZI|nr:hypothetical protein BD289DRAFT_420990 [Coniella lustricola]